MYFLLRRFADNSRKNHNLAPAKHTNFGLKINNVNDNGNINDNVNDNDNDNDNVNDNDNDNVNDNKNRQLAN